MKYLIFILFAVLNIQCSSVSNNNLNKDCVENLEFKKVFNSYILQIENYTVGKTDDKEKFNTGIKFISRYCHVSDEELMNYANEYTNLNAFEKDKKSWLKWYEDNKCSNIQFK